MGVVVPSVLMPSKLPGNPPAPGAVTSTGVIAICTAPLAAVPAPLTNALAGKAIEAPSRPVSVPPVAASASVSAASRGRRTASK